MTTFATWLVSLLPTPVSGALGEAWARAHGDALDSLERRANDAVVGRGLADAPVDALAHHGNDRRIPRLVAEVSEDWRARLVGAWETWAWATTDRGLRTPIVLSGIGSPRFLPQRDFPREPHPGILWARFTVLFSGRASWDGLTPWDGEIAWGGRTYEPIETMDLLQVRRSLETILWTWKSARDRVTSVIIARGASLWDASDDALWDDDDTVWDDGDEVTELASECWDEELVWDSPGPAGNYDFFL